MCGEGVGKSMDELPLNSRCLSFFSESLSIGYAQMEASHVVKTMDKFCTEVREGWPQLVLASGEPQHLKRETCLPCQAFL